MPADGRASRWGSPGGAAARACSRDRLARRPSNPSRARGGAPAPLRRFGTGASGRAPTVREGPQKPAAGACFELLFARPRASRPRASKHTVTETDSGAPGPCPA